MKHSNLLDSRSDAFTALFSRKTPAPQNLRKVKFKRPSKPRSRRAGAGQDSRHPVIPQSRLAAEHEAIARLEQDLLHRILALQPAEQESRAVADREGDHRRTRCQRLRALVLVLVQPHPARRGVPIDDAEVGEEVEAGGTAGPGGDAGELGGQRRHRPAVDVRADVLVGVGPRVPVTPEAQHPDAHRMPAADDRRVEARLARAELQALRRNGDLFGVREIAPQVPCPRRNLQAIRTQLGEHRSSHVHVQRAVCTVARAGARAVHVHGDTLLSSALHDRRRQHFITGGRAVRVCSFATSSVHAQQAPRTAAGASPLAARDRQAGGRGRARTARVAPLPAPASGALQPRDRDGEVRRRTSQVLRARAEDRRRQHRRRRASSRAAGRARSWRCAPTWTACRCAKKSTCRSRARRSSKYEGQDVGVMHACGHDTHMAILLATARVLTQSPGSAAGHRQVHLSAGRRRRAR